MKIAAIDLFYLALPEITTAADGTQDSLLVRVRSDDGLEGWGECDASPLVTLAAFVCPPSHGNIINLRTLLVGETVDSPADIERIHAKVLRGALDIAQVHHALSGADIALWDLLGKARGVPVWQLLARWGDEEDDAMPHGKIPYASVLFGETPDETRERAAKIRGQGFTAAKFGWGPMGQANEELDVALVRAARQGLGEEPRLMVDAGVAWGVDDRTAAERAARFAEMGVTWLEEPLLPDAVDAYARLAARQPAVAIAAGEGCGTFRAAVDLIDNGGVDFIQIDAGRIGGITVAYRVRRLAEARGIHYVNHTFKSHVSLAASLHVFATSAGFDLLEFPAEPGELCGDLVADPLSPDAAGRIAPRSRPGLGIELDLSTLRRFRKALRLEFEGEILFESR